MESTQFTETERKIIDSAKEVFLEKGMDGARMQEIAEKAGINKALLHYYFRTKEKLFLAIFKIIFKQILPEIESTWTSDLAFEKKIEKFVSIYLEMLDKNPFMPMFVLREINRNPTLLLDMMKKTGFNIQSIVTQIQIEIDKGKLMAIDPRHFIINLLSMCLFPYIGRPLFENAFFNGNKAEYQHFLNSRRELIPILIMQSVTELKN